MIKAPYNFVPLSDKVVFPEWSGRISHDIPFSDGLSGSITVRLTAQTPIFVRNGHSQEGAKNNTLAYQSFSVLPDGKYFLPGTTVKGAIRSVLEIMSFGKIRLDGSARFAQREWYNERLYTLKEEQQSLHCGWLRPIPNGYEIVDCGRPLRISHKDIDTYLGGKNFENSFSEGCRQNLNRRRKLDGVEYDPKTSFFKYKLVERIFKRCGLEDPIAGLRNLKFSAYSSNCVRVDKAGDITGTIVLTGQPNVWKYKRPEPGKRDSSAGKFYEFVFSQPNGKTYSLTEEEFDQYKFIYADSDDWNYAKEKLMPVSGIPVFFRVENDKIKDWGLAYLYKLPYSKTPFDTLPKAHKSDELDMADCIFGYTGKTAEEASLRGRVQFTPFLSDNAQKDENCTLALCSPKASYYPIYIKQNGKGNTDKIVGDYKTYNDGCIKGWKRYLVRQKVWSDKTGDDKIDTDIYPLKAGTIFEGTIRFHNLKPEELGALFSALTFHGNGANCFHQLGMARPYGYGKVQLEIVKSDIKSVGASDKEVLAYPESYMDVFEAYMQEELKSTWSKEIIIRELLILASKEVKDTDNTKFDYMKLKIKDANGKNKNEFLAAKKDKEYLRYYSEIVGDCKPQEKSVIESDLQRSQKAVDMAAQNVQEAEDAVQRGNEVEAKKREEAKKAKIEAGLSFLEEKSLSDKNKYLIEKFSTIENKVSDWLKIAELDKVPEDQYEILADALKRLAGKPTRDEKRKKLW
ncbi:MAG: TIGR03986 family CRISPR-associated RAMP protein, partial [Muribaculaceae bacterium]|nr:TIGR03986 family CRISPR-associated RAMP protein [Muribaculaceae bacterium]